MMNTRPVFSPGPLSVIGDFTEADCTTTPANSRRFTSALFIQMSARFGRFFNATHHQSIEISAQNAYPVFNTLISVTVVSSEPLSPSLKSLGIPRQKAGLDEGSKEGYLGLTSVSTEG